MKVKTGLVAGLLVLSTQVSAEDIKANVQWAELTPLKVGVSGRVVEPLIRSGSRVAAGDQLLVLARPDLEASVSSAQTNLQAVSLALDEAKRELDRAQELYERTVLSDHDLMKAKIAYQLAVSEHASAEQQLASASTTLSWSRLEAPFDGLVVHMNTRVGDLLLADEQLVSQLSIARTDRLWLIASITGFRARSLQPGQALKVKLDGKSQPAVVEQIVWQPSKNDGWLLTVSTEGDFFNQADAEASIILP